MLAGNREACSDCHNKPIVGDVIPMLLRKGGEVGVCGIAFMGDMCGQDASAESQQTFRAHAVYVFYYLTSAEMVATRLFGAVGVIQDYDVEGNLVFPETLPGLFW